MFRKNVLGSVGLLNSAKIVGISNTYTIFRFHYQLLSPMAFGLNFCILHPYTIPIFFLSTMASSVCWLYVIISCIRVTLICLRKLKDGFLSLTIKS